MRGYLGAEETELLALTGSVLGKLRNMSGEEYAELELFPDFDGAEWIPFAKAGYFILWQSISCINIYGSI